jgi:protein LTV1
MRRNTVRLSYLSLSFLRIVDPPPRPTEYRETIKRPKTETAEDKKARKAAVKAERASRRVEKKSTKDAFAGEVNKQKGVHKKRVAEGGAADIRSGQVGVRRLA